MNALRLVFGSRHIVCGRCGYGWRVAVANIHACAGG